MSNLFEKAARGKYRFNSAKGLLTVEQLYDLPLKSGTVNLNQIAIDLNREIKETQEESFVDTKSTVDQQLVDRLEIVKHIIATIKQEQEDANKAQEVAKERNKLMAILSRKQEAKLEDMDEESILKRLEELKTK